MEIGKATSTDGLEQWAYDTKGESKGKRERKRKKPDCAVATGASRDFLKSGSM